MGYKDIKEMHLKDVNNANIEKLKKALQKACHEPVKFVGLKLIFLTEGGMLVDTGMHTEGFDPKEYDNVEGKKFDSRDYETKVYKNEETKKGE